MNTIAAISTPIGVGGIGIVRASGDEALNIADAVFNFKHVADGQRWEPMKLNFGTFDGGDFCDDGYAVYIPAKKAYTGEDTVEFYLHGGVRIVEGALAKLIEKGAKLADRGEFTKRAFLAGRLSLADAEGVIDMINAESASALRAAYRLMDGKLAKEISAICDALEEVIAGLEATIDYPEETEDDILPPLEHSVREILGKINALLSTAKTGRLVKYGVTAVLAGKTNVGKSSLMNALLGEDRAIVTDVAGTTRDTVEAAMECNGVRINLVDTAGLRDSDDLVEAEGIERAKRALNGADVILHVIDKTDPDDKCEFPFGTPVFDVYNKCDLGGFEINRKMYTFAVSARTGEGIEELRQSVAALCRQNGDGEVVTNERHISALYRAKEALESAICAIGGTVDCTLIDLIEGYNALGEITGKTATEDVVNAIFANFCVGK